jgi:hypothetical protein
VLAGSLDRMRGQLGDSLEEIRRRESRARALHEVGTGILRIQERDKALNLIVGEACRLLAGDAAMLCLHEAQTQHVVAIAMAGHTETVLARDALACPAPDLGGCPILAPGYRTGHLVAPVRVGDAVLGWLCVGTRTLRSFTQEDAVLLESFGTLAALALVVDATGTIALPLKARDDVGGPHPITVRLAGKTLAQTTFLLTPSAFALEPGSGPAGTTFTVHLKGVGWTETANIYHIVYDNAYIGYACGFNSQGDVRVFLKATGGSGWHFIDLYPGIYRGREVGGVNNFRIPQLTFAADHPGERLPAFRFAFFVTK